MSNRNHLYRVSQKVSTVATFLLMVFSVGCGAPKTIKTRADFDRLTQRHGMGHFYYIGTEDDFHYFASSHLAERTRFYRYPKADYRLDKTFPKTKEKSQWIATHLHMGTWTHVGNRLSKAVATPTNQTELWMCQK